MNLRWRWLLGLSFMSVLGLPGQDVRAQVRDGVAKPEIMFEKPALASEGDFMAHPECPVMAQFGQTARRAKSAVCDTVRLEIGWWLYDVEFPIYLALSGDENASGVIEWGDGKQTPCSVVKDEDGEATWKTYGHAYETTGTYEIVIYTSSPDIQIVGVHVDTYGAGDYRSLVNRIDVRRNPSLQCLLCEPNRLDSLDVTQNPALVQLQCTNCNLSALDVSKNAKLKFLECADNKLTELVLGRQDSLAYLYCYNNRLTSLALNGCPALTELYCYSNRLTSLDVSKNAKLEVLNGHSNRLTSLVVTKMTNLVALVLVNNQLTSLEVSENKKLQELYCNNNQLTSLNVSKNEKLQTLYCYNNRLTTLDVSQDTALIRLNCYDNRLTSLNVSKNEKLQYLYCYNNRLTSLDVSKDTALLDLFCYDNQLSSLDVSKNEKLQTLYCDNNRLTSLNVSKKLQYLYCANNRLTSLDVSKDTALLYLFCDENQLLSLDVLKNEKLQLLSCYHNRLTSLNLTKNPNLRGLQCSYNQLEWATLDTLSQLECGQCYLTPQWKEVSMPINGKLDLTAYMTYKGQKTVCNFNQIPASDYTFADGGLQIKRAGYYTFTLSNPAVMQGEDSIYINYGVSVWPEVSDTLRWVWEAEAGQYMDFGLVATLEAPFMINWGDGKDTVVETSSYWGINDRLGHLYAKAGKYEVKVYGTNSHFLPTQLYLGNLKVQSVALGDAPSLVALGCSENQLTALDVTKNEKLEYLNCSDNQLTALDVTKNEKLEYLNCSDNQLTALDVSKNGKLQDLYCSLNRLASLDVTKNTDLKFLECFGNELTALDVAKNEKLEALYCSNNRLTSLAIKNEKLTTLYCYNNRLTSLDVSKDTALMGLQCSNNRLSSLDVSKNVKLAALYCADNRLTVLDVSKNVQLTELNCSDNRLTVLDVSKNVALMRLYCDNNRLTSLDLSALESLSYPSAWGNFREVTLDAQRSIALSALPGLDAQKMTYIFGGHLDEAGTHLIFELDTVNYEYETGLGTVYFRLLAAKPGEKQIPLTAEFFPDEIFRAYVAVYDKDGNDSLSTYERGVVTYIGVQGVENWSRGIKRLDGLRYFENLERLDCSYNDLTSLEVPGNLALWELNCSHNQLASLDVSKDTVLMYLYCKNNRLTSLDVSKDTALMGLDCSHNLLTSLDVSKNIWLTSLYCAENRMPLSVIADIQTDSLSLLEKVCTPQYIPVELDLEQEETLDLTSEMRIKGMATGVDFNTIPASAYTFADGILQFKRDGTYRIRLTNDSVKSTAAYWYNGEYEYVEDTVKVFYDITVKPLPPVDPVDPDDPDDPDHPAIEGIAEAAPFAYVQGHTVYLADGLGEVEAFTAIGQRVYRGYDRAITLPRPGVYVLRVVTDGRRCKVIVR